MTRYNQETEAQMKQFFSGLSEKEQRHYAALESLKLGRGGQSYLSQLFQISRYRIRMGEKELKNSALIAQIPICLLYTSPSPRDQRGPRMPSSA